MIEATHSEAVILRSVKKFFVDAFAATYPVFFEFVDKQPETAGTPEPVWIIVTPQKRYQDTLAYADLQIHIFCEAAADGVASAVARDAVVEKLIDLTQTDGCKRLVCYDSNWDPAFTSRLTVQGDSD
jgi:hypothetical protein